MSNTVRLLDAISSKRSLSVLLSAVEASRTTRTALALAPVTAIGNYSHTCAAYSNCSYYSRVAFISLRASDYVATIQGWHLFEEIPSSFTLALSVLID